MRIRRRGRRLGPNPGLTSLGDIAFLLIACFLILSNFSQREDIELTLPKSSDVDEMEAPPIAITIDDEHKIYFDGDVTTVDELGGLLDARVAQLDEKLARRPGAGAPPPEGETDAEQAAREEAARDKRRVILEFDEDTPEDVYKPIIEIVAERGLPVALGGDPEEDGDGKPPK